MGGIPCLTIYALDIQRSVKKSVFAPPKDLLYFRKIEIYERAKSLLQNLGYEPLFQNNFAKPSRGWYRHKVRRWENVSLLALGAGSMGYRPTTSRSFAMQN